jgi:hypothetical protein
MRTRTDTESFEGTNSTGKTKGSRLTNQLQLDTITQLKNTAIDCVFFIHIMPRFEQLVIPNIDFKNNNCEVLSSVLGKKTVKAAFKAAKNGEELKPTQYRIVNALGGYDAAKSPTEEKNAVIPENETLL